MISQETIERLANLKTTADKAIDRHVLAVTAFKVACARHDWALAEKEQQAALAAFAEYMDAVQAIYRLSEPA
jgi:6,7-dimethyl-8-ribityllumazine synthase